MKYPLVKPEFPKECYDNLKKCIDDGWVSSKGGFVARSEILLAAKLKRDYALATSSGTTALHLALKAIGIKEGDEVIVPNLTFIAPVNAIIHCGAIPVLIDSHKYFWNMDEYQIESKITPKTKAVIAVHLYGLPCNMYNIRKICDEYGLWLIEDAAEALGGFYRNEPIGSFGDVSIVSFFANKNIIAGEGGMAFTNYSLLRDNMIQLRDHGTDTRMPHYYHPIAGYNYRMTNLQAAILEPQIKDLYNIVEKKAEIFNLYNKFLKDYTILPKVLPEGKEGYWLYSSLFPQTDRDELMIKLREKEIETRPFFRPAHTMPYINYSTDRYSVSCYLSKYGMNLPSYTQLTEENIEEISKVIVDSV